LKSEKKEKEAVCYKFSFKRRLSERRRPPIYLVRGTGSTMDRVKGKIPQCTPPGLEKGEVGRKKKGKKYNSPCPIKKKACLPNSRDKGGGG